MVINGQTNEYLPTGRGDGTVTLSITPLPETAGIHLRDAVERRECQLRTNRPVDPEHVATEPFVFPVDEAIRIQTRSVTLPTVVSTYVRDVTGELITEVECFSTRELPSGTYVVELCTPIKCYLQVDGPLTVDVDLDHVRVECDEESAVLVGARSRHERPAHTVTTTDEPADVMAAISTFGSALKTMSPERSYPTLRGHPPAIERGDTLSIPDHLSPPDSGVRLELPPDLRYAFVAAPLAYYLGATVVPGSRPRLVTDTGYVHGLRGSQGFEGEVERVLKQTFLLDCMTRTEGLYPVSLHERQVLERELSLDFTGLYDRSLPAQLEAYLDVPFSELEDHIPAWKVTTHVEPNPTYLDVLPFVVNELAVIRTPEAARIDPPEVVRAAVEDFVRSADTNNGTAEKPSVPTVVKPERTDSLEQAWVGEEAPIRASKVTVDAYRNKLSRDPSDGTVEVTVVCNDQRMADEHDDVGVAYRSQDAVSFDVDLHRDLSVTELRSVLESDRDFVHYVGHIDDDGFACPDGRLDATDLDTVGIDAFLLNACTSYQQGMALIEAGAIAGIVTLTDVIDSGALEIGRSIARLVQLGFPLRAALDVARGRSLVGDQYLIVGDGNFDVAQVADQPPMTWTLESAHDGYDVTVHTYPTSDAGMGCMTKFVWDADVHYLGSGELGTFSLTSEQVKRSLTAGTFPVEVDGELHWSTDLVPCMD